MVPKPVSLLVSSAALMADAHRFLGHFRVHQHKFIAHLIRNRYGTIRS